MQVKTTYIVIGESNSFQTLYSTYKGGWYITTHMPGRLTEISKEDAELLINKMQKY